MKVEQVSNRPSLEVVSIVTFDPWPFDFPTVAMRHEVVFIDPDGEVGDYSGYVLDTCDNRLVTLSDGRVAVASPDWDGHTLKDGGAS